MAKIIENNTGRRLIRLTPEDILSVVSLYQQHQSQESSNLSYQDLKLKLTENPMYLPEEV
ncbi:MAG: hypothetical protein K2X66_18920 [Cyanobacteria bacterium]|nr:hypothetical protein [Cyanobacteriota bacterium]